MKMRSRSQSKSITSTIDVYIHYRRLLILALNYKLFSTFFLMWTISYGTVTLRQRL